ncbi:low molecular weight protein arginine phosphatase [Petrocella sp. FN5]|uniref:low molecular weight protein arginine phosphatase n=1 Tax=Petrocella sp. FN5 TaxID=3032002 RepID=UPI0023DB3028|nr:low molecular weight protein arginine phosphatase [Petrocella sp. FN5]MDF1617109.1 low molecular weight protein arginine phosphatase [Petrocella sp. FN5]
MKDLMFVCTGNTCRSPIAEGLAKKIMGNNKAIICSRGISVNLEEPANMNAVKAMEKKHISLKNHKSKRFDPKEVTENMLILTMTTRHETYLKYHYPMLEDKVYALLPYIQMTGDVKDPYGLGQEVYDQCADQLETAISKLMDQLRA